MGLAVSLSFVKLLDKVMGKCSILLHIRQEFIVKVHKREFLAYLKHAIDDSIH